MSDLPVPVEKSSAIPVLPLRDVVVYPHMVIPLFVGREKSILALEAAMKGDKRARWLAGLVSRLVRWWSGGDGSGDDPE